MSIRARLGLLVAPADQLECRGSNEHFERLFQSLGDAVFVVDDEQRVILQCNRAAIDIFGYTEAELVGSTTRFLYADEDAHRRSVEHYAELSDRGASLIRLQGRRKTGELIDLEVCATAQAGIDGSRRLVSVVRDVTTRERARVEAEAARAQTAHILEGISDGFVALDRELRYTYVNARAGELFGRDPQSLLGKGYLEEYPEAAGSAFHLAYERALTESEPFEFEEHYEPWDRWFENRVYPTDDGVSIFFHEITARKLAELDFERALAAEREARSALDGFIAAAPIGIAFLDSDLRLVVVNDLITELTGVAVADHIGRTSDEVAPPGSPSFEPLMRGVLETGEPLKLDLTGITTSRHPDADAVLSVNCFQTRTEAGDPTGVGAFVEDVTEARKASEALASHARRLENLRRIDADILRAESPEETAGAALTRIRDLIPCLRASVAEFDLDERMISVVAVSLESGLTLPAGPQLPMEGGIDLEELRDRGVLMFDDLQVKAPEGTVFAALRELGVRAYFLVPLIVEGKLIGSLNISGDTPGQYGDIDVEIAHEVADQLAVALRHSRLLEQAERHAEELEQRVEERTAELAERNNELDAFSYTISHDLRAPLRAMKGLSQALVEDYGGAFDGDARDLMDRIVRAAHRMDELIADILAYSRLTRTEVRSSPLDVDAVVDEVLHALELRIAETGAKVRVARPLGRVLAHGPTLAMSLSNLIDNALRYVEPGAAPHVEIRSERRDGHVRLWVEDLGIGIPAEHHERVFGVFERLHGEEAYAGTGIGLASVRKGIERMDGRVGVESEPGQGSRFWVELRAEDWE